MKKLVNDLKTATDKRRNLNRTYHELRDMPRATAIDLGLFPEDAYEVAYRAVYRSPCYTDVTGRQSCSCVRKQNDGLWLQQHRTTSA